MSLVPKSLFCIFASATGFCVRAAGDTCTNLPIFSNSPMIGAEYRVDDLVMPTTYDVYDPQVAANSSGDVVHVWLEAIFGNAASHRIYCKASSDYGNTITATPARVDSTPAPNGFSDPRIAMDNNGHIYAIWKRTMTFTAQVQLYFTRSTDGGLIWEPDRRIDHAAVPIGIVSPAQIAADDNGNVYVVWSDTRVSNKWRIFLQHSSDFGVTWLPDDVRVDHNNTSSNRSENPQLAVDSNGHVYIAWEDNRQSANSIYFNSSSDHGATFQPSDLHVDSLPPGSAYLVEAPTIAASQSGGSVGSGGVHVLWRDVRNGNYQAWFNHSNDFGLTFAGNQRVDHGPTGIHTDLVHIACDNSGHVFGLWTYAEPGPNINVSKLWLNISNDSGGTWNAADTRIDAASGTTVAHFGKIGCDNVGHVFLAWTQESYCSPACVNAQDVYYTTSKDSGASFAAALRLDGAPANTNQSPPELAVPAIGGCGIAYASWRDNRNLPAVGDPLINLYTRSFAAEAPSPADINRDGIVNAADLLAVINAWGPCPPGLKQPPGCSADIAPRPGGDGVVNLADLLMVINSWG